jgi:hypothetical protein
MKSTTKSVIVLTLIFSKCLTTRAQQLTFSKFEVGAGAGVFVYQGDLTPTRLGSYKTLKPAFNFFVGRIINPRLTLRTNIAFGQLKGDDAKYASPVYRQERNFNFHTPVFELSELVVVDLLRDNLVHHPNHFSPYLFTGVGISFLRIRRNYDRFNTEYFLSEPATTQGLAEDAQHSLPGLIPVVPLGVGIKYAISERLMISAETSYRFAFTDYLDGFSKAANDRKKDSYQTHTIGVIYRFASNNSMKCPKL